MAVELKANVVQFTIDWALPAPVKMGVLGRAGQDLWGVCVDEVGGDGRANRRQSQKALLFGNKRAALYNGIKCRVGLVLAQAAALRIHLNLDGAPISSRAFTHPTHRTNSFLISTAL